MRHQLSHSVDYLVPSGSHGPSGGWNAKLQHPPLGDNFNSLMKIIDSERLELEENKDTSTESADNIFNNAAHVWNHAYYINYRNARTKHVETLWDIVS